jgi:hypothetical protein
MVVCYMGRQEERQRGDREGHSSKEGSVRSRVSCGPVSP